MRFQELGDPQLGKMLDACWQWSSAWMDGQQPRWLSLLGTSGTGKTHCCRRLWDHFVLKCDYSRFDFMPAVVYWPTFLQRLRKGNAWDLRDDLRRWPLLFLDDIGADRDPSGFAADELNALLGARMGRWTLITSNRTLDQLGQTDARIASRMIRDRNICVSVTTRDYSTR